MFDSQAVKGISPGLMVDDKLVASLVIPLFSESVLIALYQRFHSSLWLCATLSRCLIFKVLLLPKK